MRALGVIGWLLLAATAPAATSDATRQAVIEPLNSELHRHLTWNGAREVYPGRGETTLRWDGEPGAEPLRVRYERLLEYMPEGEERAIAR